jgi:monofunctional biosynthetic peptidoglycan transglycosylase
VYLTLPDVRPLRTTNPSTTAFIELRAREARGRGVAPRRVQRWVRYAQVSNTLKKAVLVAEDSAFWRHEGVDFDELQKSMEVNLERRQFLRGGSTITQQLAKNLYLSPSRNPVRKLREFLIARRLEAELSKTRILELYLNVIEWGDGIYGAEAAARTYFRKPASALGAEEAALLAGAIVNPRLLNPAHPTRRLLARQRLILRRMGAVTPPPPEPVAIIAAPPETPLAVPGEPLAPESRPETPPQPRMEPVPQLPAQPPQRGDPPEPPSAAHLDTRRIGRL